MILQEKLLPYRIFLGSASPRRQILLQELGIKFVTLNVANVEEIFPPELPLEEVPSYLASLKAKAYYPQLNHGSQKFKDLGTTDSRGSKVFSVSGDTPKAGIYELELGMSVDHFVEEFGDGDTKAVQVGGASGFCVPRKKFGETIIGFEGVPTGGSMSGSSIDTYEPYLVRHIRLSEQIKPRSMYMLDEDMAKAMQKMQRARKIMCYLPGVDCGVCGAPS